MFTLVLPLRNKDMKVKAKEINIGDTFTSGVITMTVEKIQNTFQKNGKALILFSGKVSRNMGRGFKRREYYCNDMKVKAETFVQM